MALIMTNRGEGVSKVRTRVFFWDWKEQPPMDEIAAAVQELSAGGSATYMREADTGTEDHAWVVSDAELSDEQASEAYEAALRDFEPVY